jgi:hypothetical protein
MDKKFAEMFADLSERWRAAMDVMREMMSTWPDCV